MKGVLNKSFPVSLEPSLMVEKCLQSLQREIKNLAGACINQVEEYICRVLYRGEHWEESFYNTFFPPAIIDRLTVMIKNTLERDTGYPAFYLAPDQVRPGWSPCQDPVGISIKIFPVMRPHRSKTLVSRQRP